MQNPQTLDYLWILICAALVMLMQGGFCCLESGLVRAKNSINVAIKNLADFCISSMLFWAFGFALMFGASVHGLIGASRFFLTGEVGPWLLAFFLFQLVFCGTATTIVSGAVAERMRFAGYLLVSLVLSALIYPLMGHWAWGGAEGGGTKGWLAAQGFIDFAGSTVVHSVGGWVALAAVLVVGPRTGRFSEKGISIQAHNLPLATLGVLLLWFGWFGFNGGSTLAVTEAIPLILVNTTLAGAAGGVTAIAITWIVARRPDVGQTMNGVLAGLVGITASCHIISPAAAAGIGCLAGCVCFGASRLLEKLKVDDVIGAVPVHACAGAWGTIAVALFADPTKFGTGLDRWNQLLVQLTGVSVCFAWAFGVGFLWIGCINRFLPLRVTRENEHVGLNVAEHGVSTAMLDLLGEMEDHRDSGDFSDRVLVEPHTEVGEIAAQYNRVLDAVEAKAEEVRQMQEQLRQSQKMEAVGELSAGIAHEFNNLLQAIQGYTRFAMDALSSSEQPYKDLEQAFGASTRAATITHQLLGFSRREVLRKEPLAMNDMVAGMADMLRPLVGEQIELSVCLADNAGTVVADRNTLEQMLMNLCINAKDAMPDGGSLTIKTQGLALNREYCELHGLANPGNYVRLVVADTGCGMSPEVQACVFDPFFTTKEVGKGTGLGLAMIYGVVKQHEGTIHVYSEPDVGTTFKIYLPASVTESVIGDKPRLEEIPSGKETILIAEDDATVRNIGVRMLERAGYATIEAGDGEHAISIVKEKGTAISLILMDVVMPKMTGREAYQHIRAINADIPVVFCTGYDPTIHQPRCGGQEDGPLIEKPFDPDVVLRVVRRALDERSRSEITAVVSSGM